LLIHLWVAGYELEFFQDILHDALFYEDEEPLKFAGLDV
jgi:hypothetical protein